VMGSNSIVKLINFLIVLHMTRLAITIVYGPI
jgi:hypothetical protein